MLYRGFKGYTGESWSLSQRGFAPDQNKPEIRVASRIWWGRMTNKWVCEMDHHFKLTSLSSEIICKVWEAAMPWCQNTDQRLSIQAPSLLYSIQHRSKVSHSIIYSNAKSSNSECSRGRMENVRSSEWCVISDESSETGIHCFKCTLQTGSWVCANCLEMSVAYSERPSANFIFFNYQFALIKKAE